MPNILTALQPVLFSVAQEVAAEPFGAISAINTSFDSKGVARGDKVKVPVAPIRSNTAFSPSNITSTGADATATAVEVEITKSQLNSFNLTGEQISSLENGGNYREWVRQMLGQMMRALRNEAEADAVAAIKAGSSRAVGTAGTNPFASNINAMADVRKILRDNGAPMADPQMIFDTTSEAALFKLGIITEADKAGSDAERRSGVLGRQFGFQLRQSAGITLHTKGTGASYTSSTGGPFAIGTRDIPLITGTGTVLPGDVVTFAADSTNKYVVNTGVSAPGTITLGRPGVLTAIPNSNAMTVGNNYTPILAFERSAVVGVMRPPAMPANPTISQMLISDGKGMTYLLLDIAQYGQRTWELHLAWGFKTVQSEFVATLLG